MEQILSLIYVEFTLSVVVVTQLFKFITNIDTKRIHPKYITLIIGTTLGIADYFYREELDIYKLILSFGLAIIFYDYIWKEIYNKFPSKKKVK